MGINETGKIDFSKYVNNDNFKNAKVTKESKFVANVFGEAVKTRAIASKDIAMDGKLSVAEKDVLKNAIKTGVIQGLSAKELTDLPDRELEQFAQYVDDLSNNKVPAQTKEDMSALEEANKSLKAKLEKLQASMDSTTNVKNQEIKALNEKYTAQQTELNSLKAAEQKKAEAAEKQKAANDALLNKKVVNYPYRTWADKDRNRCDKIEQRFRQENITLLGVNNDNDYQKDYPDLKIDVLNAISRNPVIMKRLSKGNDGGILFNGELIHLSVGKKSCYYELYNNDNVTIGDICKFFETSAMY